MNQLLVLFYPECEMLLAEVAEYNDDNGGNQLGDGGVNMEVFDKKFNENVVQEEVDEHNHKIAEQLNLP
jgi:hypothetical protein